jgi:hypothetical protein
LNAHAAYADPSVPRKHARWSSASREQTVSIAILLGIIAAGIIGWSARAHLPSPEQGMGYNLGIAGSALMLLLLGYPLRKRLKSARWLGSVGMWFRLHMFLGLLGPLVILYHARFSYSATNSAVALSAMLIVAFSGLIGRYLYGHVHRGYSQKKLVANQLLGELVTSRLLLDADGDDGHRIVKKLEQLELRAVRPRLNLLQSISDMSYIAVKTRLIGWRIPRLVREELAGGTAGHIGLSADLPAHGTDFSDHLQNYLHALRDVSGFASFERMFRAWHVLHLPLFLFLLVTATIHVIAVHMY